MIQVVCAVIEKNGLLLATRRPAHKKEGLKWEFPGGKIESGETEEIALAREINEELSIDVLPSKKLASITLATPYPIQLVAWKCEWITGEIKLTEHVAYRWISLDELGTIDLSEADRMLLPELSEKLRFAP